MNHVDNYVAPKVTKTLQPSTVTVSLEQFKPEEIAEYLRRIGYRVDGMFSRALLDAMESRKSQRKVHAYGCTCDCMDCDTEEGLLLGEDDLGRVETLLLCGQRDSAREFVLGIVGDHIGRPL